MERLHLLLVDDHPLFRQGLAATLADRQGIKIVGQAKDGDEAITLARQTRPDIILMDIHMPKCGGLEATKTITQALPDVQIIMLTVSEEDEDLFEAIKHGASGYLLKNLEPQELIEMIH